MAKRNPVEIWGKLAETGLLPHFSSHARLASNAASEADLNPGIVGALLAQQECVNGEYPLSTAFFDLTLACVARKVPAAASLSYIAKNIFPCYRQWRFESATDRERFGQKMLSLFNTFLKEDSDSSMKDLLCVTLVQPGPLQTLLSLIGTGDRAIRSLLEAQSSWETGVGVELSRLVNLAMTVFERLLILAAGVPSLSHRIEDISHLLCSLPASTGQHQQPHFLLTLAHYVYHSQSCELPVSAMRLLGTVARMFPMSLLACLGGDAEAIRDVLIYRLESQTEDVSLKVAIVDLFSACVDSQPGFIQLLIGIKQDVHVVGAAKPLTAEEKDKNASVKLVSEQGCLRLILELLSTVTKTEDEAMSKKLEGLHLSLVNFILNLWQHQRILAMSYLKRQSDFWNRLTWSVFDPKGRDRLNINGKIFRIMANEIYTYKGEVDKELLAALERLCDEKEDLVVKWNERILSRYVNDFTFYDQVLKKFNFIYRVRTSVAMEEESPQAGTQEDNLSLLNAWKAFLTVFSKDQPVAISPLQCHEVTLNFFFMI